MTAMMYFHQDAGAKADELTLICKTTRFSSGSTFAPTIFASEGLMYNKVLPAFQAIANMKKHLPWPSCRYVSVEGPSTPILVLADMRPEGFAMADRTKPLDFDHCRLALKALARFHGAGMALKHLKPDTFLALAKKLDNPFLSMKELLDPFGQAIITAGDVLQDRFPPTSETGAKMKKARSVFMERFYTAVEPTTTDVGCAFIHGDCHVNNVMFQYDKASGAVKACRLIDFQTSRYGCTTMDLGSLLLPSTDKATRDKHWHTLLRGYHDELQATLRDAGCEDPDAVYSWEQFMDKWKSLGSQYGLCMTPLLLHALCADAADVQELRESISELDSKCGKNNVEDKKSTDAVAPMVKIKATPQLKQRFGDVVLDLVDWGLL